MKNRPTAPFYGSLGWVITEGLLQQQPKFPFSFPANVLQQFHQKKLVFKKNSIYNSFFFFSFCPHTSLEEQYIRSCYYSLCTNFQTRDIRVFLLGLLLLDLCRIGPLQSRVLDLDCGSSWGCEPSFQRLFRFVNLFSELENPGFENPNLMMPREEEEEYCTMDQLLLT